MATKKLEIYFQTITPESAEQGDFAETGHEETKKLSSIQEAIKEIQKYCVEASSSNFHKGIWYSSTDPDTDYTTGEEKYNTLHLEGFSEFEERVIYKAVTGEEK